MSTVCFTHHLSSVGSFIELLPYWDGETVPHHTSFSLCVWVNLCLSHIIPHFPSVSESIYVWAKGSQPTGERTTFVTYSVFSWDLDKSKDNKWSFAMFFFGLSFGPLRLFLVAWSLESFTCCTHFSFERHALNCWFKTMLIWCACLLLCSLCRLRAYAVITLVVVTQCRYYCHVN